MRFIQFFISAFCCLICRYLERKNIVTIFMACFTIGFVVSIGYSCLFGFSVVSEAPSIYVGMSLSMEILLLKLTKNVEG